MRRALTWATWTLTPASDTHDAEFHGHREKPVELDALGELIATAGPGSRLAEGGNAVLDRRAGDGLSRNRSTGDALKRKRKAK